MSNNDRFFLHVNGESTGWYLKINPQGLYGYQWFVMRPRTAGTVDPIMFASYILNFWQTKEEAFENACEVLRTLGIYIRAEL